MSDSKNYDDWHSWIEKRVCAKDKLYGTLKYFGVTHFSNGLWCGIELDSPLGKNDGMVNNVRYFTCNSNFGIFIPVSKVTMLEDFSKDNVEIIANLNDTFKIDNSLKEQKVETNRIISDFKTPEEKLSNSLLGSTESLGILSLDLIDHDNSWDDFKLNCSLSDEVFPNYQNMRENKRPSFLESATVSERDMCDTISNPKYASTPRVPKKKLVDNENNPDKFIFDIHCQESPEFLFDVDPNLTSTHKNLSELTTLLNNSKLSPILLGNKNIQQAVNLEKDFLKDKFSQNTNEILGKTFELNNSADSPLSCRKECEQIYNNKNELNLTTIIEDEKYINQNDKKLNLNATFDFQSNTLLKLSFEKIKDMTFDLKENITEKFKSDICNRNELNATTVLENHNSNATFELKSPIEQKIPDVKKKILHSKETETEQPWNLNECGKITVTDTSLLEKTFVFDLSTIHECGDSKIQDESFNSKNRFLKEIDSYQNSNQLNYRNSICLPPSFCNELKKSVRRTSSVSNYSSGNEKEKGLKEVTGRKSLIDRGSVSSLKDLHGKVNVFKKPFSPNSTLRNLKPVLKFHSSVNSKENRNKIFIKESNFSKNTSISKTNNKASINTELKKKEKAFKSKQIKTFDEDQSVFSTLKSGKLNSLSSKTVGSQALPLKNKINSDNCKQSSSVASKIYSKNMHVSKIARKDIQIPIVKKIVTEVSVNNVIKNTKSQLKMQGLDNTFISKTDDCDSLQKPNFPVACFSGKSSIPKRNSLVPCFKNKLPVGVVKPQCSMHLENDAILNSIKIRKEPFQTSEVSEQKLGEINLQSNDEINKSLKECPIVNSSKDCRNTKQSVGLPKKIKNQFCSPSNQKPGLKQPLKKGGIPTGLKIPRFSQNLKKN